MDTARHGTQRHRARQAARSRWLIAGGAAALLCLPGAPAEAQDPEGQPPTFAVTTSDDTVDAAVGDGFCRDATGACSLRAAVQEANATPFVARILLGPGAYSLSRAGAGEDAAATGDLDVSSTIEVVGDGATLDARGLDRVFDVLAGGALTVAGVALGNGAPPSGESGGCLRSVASLRLLDARVERCTAQGPGASGGGVFNDGGVLEIFGGQINFGAATRAGGAIEANGGTTLVDGAVLYRNQTGPTPGNGGALHLTGSGLVTVRGSRVLRNVAAAEGGGLWNSATGTMQIDGTRLSKNVASGADPDQGGGALFNDGGAMVVTGSDIDGNSADGAAGSGGGILNDDGELNVADTRIRDNRSARAGGGVEANAGTTRLVRTELLRNDTGDAPGNGGAFHMTGAGAALVEGGRVASNRAAREGGGLWNSATGTLSVQGVEVVANVALGDAADDGGGGAFNDGGRLEIIDSSLRDNLAPGAAGSGGGIFNNAGDTLVLRSRIERNRASRAGGGVEIVDGMTELRQVRISANQTGASPGNGGGLHLTGSGVVLVDTAEVMDNVAAAEGGGLWNASGGTMTVRNVSVSRNVANGDAADQGGGGLFNAGGTLVVSNALVDGNAAPGASGSGGGLFNDGGVLEIANATIQGNVSSRAGGGIEANVGTTELVDVDLLGNGTGATPGNGGGLHLTGAGTVDLRRGNVRDNVAAAEGGGLWNSSTGTMTVRRTRGGGNQAPVGPQVFNDGGTFTINGFPVPPGR